MTDTQEEPSSHLTDHVFADSIGIARVPWVAGADGPVGLSATLGPGCAWVGQITWVLTLAVIAHFVIRAGQVGGAARKRGGCYVRRGTGKSAISQG